MAIRFTSPNTFIVQVQRGVARRTKRGTGTEADAKLIEAALLTDMEKERKLDEAAQLLGVERPAVSGDGAGSLGGKPAVPTLREFFKDRWVPHANVVQNASTRRISRCPFNYLHYYLGDRRLDELLQPATINAFVEAMKTNGGVSFKKRKDGRPWGHRTKELTNTTINKSLQCLRALLYLAHTEGVISDPPRIDLLPEDDSKPVLPPTEAQFKKLL
jgi:hypothetical protein